MSETETLSSALSRWGRDHQQWRPDSLPGLPRRGCPGADVATLAKLNSEAGYATDPHYASKVAALA